VRRLVGLVLAGVVLAVAAAACGTGGDDSLRQIDQEVLGGLDETTTSTTTSTTIPATVPLVPPSTVTGTPTTALPTTEAVQLFFLDGNRLQPVTIQLAGQVSANRVITALLEGPPADETGIGLRTVLPRSSRTVPDLVNSVVPSPLGYAEVDLSEAAFQLIDPADQRTAIGQIVLTLVKRPGIGQVRFTLDGEPMRVPRRDGLQSEPGEPVSMQDYESLLGEVATTTTAAASTAPPSPPVPSTGPAG
jgi:hypothetical protein